MKAVMLCNTNQQKEVDCINSESDMASAAGLCLSAMQKRRELLCNVTNPKSKI
jgi:hypothetical protein